jgi:hypothetical protein
MMTPPPFLFIACFLLIALYASSMMLRQRSNWQKAADRTGLKFTPNFILSDLPGKIDGCYQEFEVTIESLSKGFKHEHHHQTRIAVKIKKRTAIYLYVRGQGAAFPKVPEFDKTKGITGQSFSPDFFVICHPTGFAIDLFSAEVQDRLKRELGFGVIIYNDDELALSWPDIDRRETELVQHLELAVYLAAQIKQLRDYL